MSWENVRLGDYIEQVRGVSYKPNDIGECYSDLYWPVLRAGNIQNAAILKEDIVYVAKNKINKKQLLSKNDILIAASSGSKEVVGKAAQIKSEMEIPTSFGAFCKVVRPKEGINPVYLGHYFQSDTYRKTISWLASGANINNLRNEHIDDLIIPFPPLPIQQKIADALDKAADLIENRKEQIILIDKLVKDTYYSFDFEKWKGEKLEAICDFITKGTTPKSTEIYEEEFENAIPFLKVYNIQDDGTIDFHYKPSYVKKETHDTLLKRSKVFAGDILMNIVGPPLCKIGIVSTFYSEMNVNQAIAIFRAQEKVNPIYLLYALKSDELTAKIRSLAVGIRQQNLSLKQCRELTIPLPPIDIQKQFSDRIVELQQQKTYLRDSLTELETIYKSIMQKALNGELFQGGA